MRFKKLTPLMSILITLSNYFWDTTKWCAGYSFHGINDYCSYLESLIYGSLNFD